MAFKFNLRKSLQELESWDWGEPTYDSHLVVTCHKLRRVPLELFSAENLRIMIGQNISLKFLIPLALERLHGDPTVHGDFYPGDLLVALLRAEGNFWTQHPNYCEEVHKIVQKALLIGQNENDDLVGFNISIEEAYQHFLETLKKVIKTP